MKLVGEYRSILGISIVSFILVCNIIREFAILESEAIAQYDDPLSDGFIDRDTFHHEAL